MTRYPTTRPRGGRRARALLAAALLTGAVTAMGGAAVARGRGDGTSSSGRRPATATPIKHLIVVMGENHSFDNVFGTYRPRRGEHVLNLLSQGIVTRSGRPGPRASLAVQKRAVDRTTYSIDPRERGRYGTLPRPNTTYVPGACDAGQAQNAPDRRFPSDLPNAPYQITRFVPYLDHHGGNHGCEIGAYVGDPVHRFYQMWQQVHEGSNDLWTWVGNTAGFDNGARPPDPTNQGGLQMGYYNMSRGDAPYLERLARRYSLADNYHQAVMGGTGTNQIMFGTADIAYYQRAGGRPAVPPHYQIENPNAKPKTNNNYTQDGYEGGSYSECSDRSEPGVSSIRSYLDSLPYTPFRGGNCAPGAYYLLNNYLPGYTPDGHLERSSPFVVPPQAFPTIADELSAKGIPWAYYGQGWNGGSPDPAVYCTICDPFQYATSVMTNPRKRRNLDGFGDFERAIAQGHLPAVSYVKPSSPNDGHPAYSTLAAFEGFAKRVVDDVKARPRLFAHTAVLVTFDEGGGYYDSGYVQPLDFFGDGTRVPMIAVSPFARKGDIDHTYYDHASILKFIEANWGLPPLSARSLDNLANPASSRGNAYVPTNRPAIGDLMNLFDF